MKMSTRELTKSKSAPRDIGSTSADHNLDSGSNSNHESDLFSFLRQVK